jgi:hypothetical protein
VSIVGESQLAGEWSKEGKRVNDRCGTAANECVLRPDQAACNISVIVKDVPTPTNRKRREVKYILALLFALSLVAYHLGS